GAHPRLACRRQHDVCRSRRRRPSIGGRLPGRCAMERRRGREELGREGEVAPLVPADSGRDLAGAPPRADLLRPRLLSDPASLKTRLFETARRHGFDVVGITRPDAVPLAGERLQQFLAEGAHGDMIWMETTAERRADPRTLWPEVRSVIML